MIKEVGYWSQKAEKKKTEVGGEQGEIGREGLGTKQVGEVVVIGGGGGGGGGIERWSGTRPGCRYSWSERESVREGRLGRTLGEERG